MCGDTRPQFTRMSTIFMDIGAKVVVRSHPRIVRARWVAEITGGTLVDVKVRFGVLSDRLRTSLAAIECPRVLIRALRCGRAWFVTRTTYGHHPTGACGTGLSVPVPSASNTEGVSGVRAVVGLSGSLFRVIVVLVPAALTLKLVARRHVDYGRTRSMICSPA